MQRIIIGLLTLTCAIAVSLVAGYFSIVGLAAIFSAAMIPVVVMGVSLEASKLMAAFWIHHNWSNKSFSFFHRTYLIAAVLALMLITSIGIYGYLMSAHMDQNAPSADAMVVIESKQAEIDQMVMQRDQLTAQQNQINDTIKGYLESGSARGASTFIRQQRAEQSKLAQQITEANENIAALNAEMLPLKKDVNAVEMKLGPIKHVASKLGIPDTEAVSILVIILMFSFDPLAVVLMISGTMTLLHRSSSPLNAPQKPIEAAQGMDAPADIKTVEPFISEASEASEATEKDNETTTPVSETTKVLPELDYIPSYEEDIMSEEEPPVEEGDDFIPYEGKPQENTKWEIDPDSINDLVEAIRATPVEPPSKEYIDDISEYVLPFGGYRAVMPPKTEIVPEIDDMPIVHSPKQKLKTKVDSDLFGRATRNDILDLLEANPDIVQAILDESNKQRPSD